MLNRIVKWLDGSYKVETYHRTTDARHWHNPADPVQAARIEAAAAKRERKAARVTYCASQSIRFNKAHLGLADGIRRANPFHVAH